MWEEEKKRNSTEQLETAVTVFVEAGKTRGNNNRFEMEGNTVRDKEQGRKWSISKHPLAIQHE